MGFKVAPKQTVYHVKRSDIDDVMRLRDVVRPVAFATGLKEFPFAAAGSCFLAGFGNKFYVVTADHVVRGCETNEVLIALKGDPPCQVPLTMGYMAADSEGQRVLDLRFYDCSLIGLSRSNLSHTRLLNLNSRAVWAWKPHAHTAFFLVCGYPLDLSEGINPATGLLRTHQAVLYGKYLGAGYSSGMHRLCVDNPDGLAEFNGFSGGAVFLIQPQLGAAPIQRFCGIALNGTPSSGIVHFLEAGVIVDALQTAVQARQQLDQHRPPD